MVMSMHGNVINRERCPSCAKVGDDKAQDNLVVYEDGYKKCFACGHYHMPGSNRTQDGNANMSKIEKRVTPLIDGLQNKAIKNRCLSEKTTAFFDYQVGFFNNEPVQVANFFDALGRLKKQRLRMSGKRFKWIGDTSGEQTFFGQHKYKGGKRLIITEGYEDAMSIAEVNGTQWPVVSLPGGAQSAEAVIKAQYKYLQGFDEIVLAFDADTPGADAMEKSAVLLPRNKKIFIAKYSAGSKDASDLLMAGKQGEIRQIPFNATAYSPYKDLVKGDYLKTDEEILGVYRKTPKPGLKFIFNKFSEAIRGIRKKEITMIVSGSGMGKTTFVNMVTLDFIMEQQQNILSIKLEESMDKTQQNYCCMANKVNFADYIEDLSLLTDEQILKFHRETVSERITFMNHFGSIDCGELIKKIEHAVAVHNIDFVVLDHISMVFSGSGNGSNDERKDIDALMGDLRGLCEATGVGIIAVVHLKRASGEKNYNTGREIGLNDLRGSQSLEGISDVIIALEGDQKAVSMRERLIRKLVCIKNRMFGAAVGVSQDTIFDPKTGLMEECDAEFKQTNPLPTFGDHSAKTRGKQEYALKKKTEEQEVVKETKVDSQTEIIDGFPF